MRHRLKLVLALGVALAGAAVIAVALTHRKGETPCESAEPELPLSEEAARELVARLLASKHGPDAVEGETISRAGARTIPFIVEAARCDRGCDKNDIASLRRVLYDMGPERAAAAPGLVAIAQDPAGSDAQVAGAVTLLGALGLQAASTESALVALRSRRPSLAVQIDDALFSMHSLRAGAIFAERFGNRAPDILQLRDLAEAGAAGRDAGPVVVALLSNAEPDVRLGAVRTLGFIGYDPAVDALTALLDDPVDVRVAWAAAESLGRLRDPRGIPALERTARAHWYPPVREAAASAAASLRNGTTFVGKERTQFPSKFFAYSELGLGIANCASPVDTPTSNVRYAKLVRKEKEDPIAKFAYPATLKSKPELPPSPTTEDVAYYAAMEAELARSPHVVPSIAMRVNDGWLAASNRGEFGGELVYLGDDGTKRQIIEANVWDMHVLGKRIVTVAGLAHMSINEGAIHEISRAPDGTMQATVWRILPAAPTDSWITNHGELLIQLESAGTVLVSADGSMRMAPCRGL